MSNQDKSLVVHQEQTELSVPDADNLLKFADAMAKSKMFPSFTDKWQVAAAVQLGIDLGIRPMVALQTMSIVKGRVCVEAKILQAQLEKNGVVIKIIESTDEIAKVQFKKDGKPGYTETFTIEEARKKGLLYKDNWKNWPGEMLYYRCISRGGRKYDPGAIFNLYLPDEMEEAKPVGKTIEVKAGQVEELREIPVEEPTEEEIQEAEVIEAEKPKRKPRKTKPKEEPKEPEKPQEEEKPVEPSPEEEPKPAPTKNYVKTIQEALKILYGKYYEDQYRLFKVFLFGFQDAPERSEARKFVVKNIFGNLSLSEGKYSDHKFLVDDNPKAFDFTIKKFESWKQEIEVKTYADYEKRLAAETAEEEEGDGEAPF